MRLPVQEVVGDGVSRGDSKDELRRGKAEHQLPEQRHLIDPTVSKAIVVAGRRRRVHERVGDWQRERDSERRAGTARRFRSHQTISPSRQIIQNAARAF